MFKLSEAEGLEKAGRSIGNFFSKQAQELEKSHAFHAAASAHHDAMKAMAAEWGGGTVGVVKAADGTALIVPSGGIEAMIHETTQHLTKKALESFDTDPAVQEKIREMVLKGISATLGDKIIPTAVSAVTPNRPGITAVPRAGAPAPAEKIPVPMEFEKLADIEA